MHVETLQEIYKQICDKYQSYTVSLSLCWLWVRN